MKFSQILKQVALAEVGVKEIGYTNTGKRVEEYQATTSLGGTGWPWCAAFVCWCVKKAVEKYGEVTFDLPKTAAAYGFDEWSLKQDTSTKTHHKHNKEFEIGIFSLHSTSHCGIVISLPDSKGFVKTIEGNSNLKGSRDGGSVIMGKRRVSDIRDFITFTI